MRVLIATVTAGGGHLAAAAAMDEAWRALRPEDVVDRVDLVKFFSPLHRKIHADGYVALVNHAPDIWGMMFGKTDHPEVARRLNRLRRIFPSKSRGMFERYVKDFEPDVVLCTHYLPLEVLEGMRKKAAKEHTGARTLVRSNVRAEGDPKQVSPPGAIGDRCGLKSARRPMAVTIVTDFEAHALWMSPCADLYCVAAEETKARLDRKSVV